MCAETGAYESPLSTAADIECELVCRAEVANTRKAIELDDPDDTFPGSIRGYGLGVAYRCYSVYNDTNKEAIQRGFQLFMTLRFGVHIDLFRERAFLEPSVAFTSWPINTNLPDSFARQEDKWPSYFLFEPGLHFGVNF